jgi:hypothetical protein
MAAEVLEELDLAQGSLGQDLLAEYIGDFLDGNTFASLGVGCGTTRGGLLISFIPFITRG